MRLLFILVFISLPTASHANFLLPENQLRTELFNGYDPEVFPLPRNGGKLEINISVAIQNLPELRVREYRMFLNGIISLSWINHQLSWNRTRYPNISGISVSKNRVWLPELLLLPERLQITFSQDDEKVFIHPNGLTEWIMQRSIAKECRFQLDDFPRDSHTCSLSIHTHIPGHLVTLRLTPSHVPDIRSNGAWSVTKIARSVGPNALHNEYAYNLDITLKRHSGYYVKKLVKPLLIISTLPLIGLLCPIESGEKVGFSVTALLTLIVTLQYTLEKLPESENDPDVVIASEASLVMMVFHVLISCLVVWLSHRQHPPPKWLINIFRSRIAQMCYLGEPKDDGRTHSVSGNVNHWAWRKVAILIDWIGFICNFIVWSVLLLPAYLEKQK